MAVKTIHMIGKRPKTAPSVADRTASPTGILKNSAATTIATRTDVRPAQCAFQRNHPRVTKTVSNGSKAMSAEMTRLPPTGASCGV